MSSGSITIASRWQSCSQDIVMTLQTPTLQTVEVAAPSQQPGAAILWFQDLDKWAI